MFNLEHILINLSPTEIRTNNYLFYLLKKFFFAIRFLQECFEKPQYCLFVVVLYSLYLFLLFFFFHHLWSSFHLPTKRDFCFQEYTSSLINCLLINISLFVFRTNRCNEKFSVIIILTPLSSLDWVPFSGFRNCSMLLTPTVFGMVTSFKNTQKKKPAADVIVLAVGDV